MMDGLAVYPNPQSTEKSQRGKRGTAARRSKANQPCSLQELMMDGLAVYPNPQTQRGKHGTARRSIYWTDQPTISRSSTVLPHYHTALALGATLVCSAGALIQHTEKSELQYHASSYRLPSDKTIAQSEKSEPVTAVVTPPIATSQTAASFSPRTDAANCTNGTCQGLEVIDRHIQPHSQALTPDRQPIQLQSIAQQTQQAILAHRRTDLANLQADLEARTQQSDQQFASLTTHLAIHPQDAEQIASLLTTDTSYQLNRLRLNGLKDAIAIEYSKPIAANPQLELLYDQYAQELAELRQIAQNILANHIANVSAEFPDPLWQDEEYYNLLQALMDVAHFRQMQVIEYNILAQMDAQLSPHRSDVAALPNQDSSARTLGAS